MWFYKLRLALLSKFKRPLFLRKNNVYYINGSETLPPPLSAELEEQMIKNISSPYARDLLIEHNLRLVAYIAKRFENTGANIEELISIGTVGLMKAVSTFNSDKNIKLATYASRCIENEILMFIRKNSTQKREVSIDEPLSVDWDGNELLLSDILGSDSDVVFKDMEEDEERRMVRSAVQDLSDRERIIVEMRYGLLSGRELTQKEVADALGISQSYISRLEKKIMSRLRKKIEEKI
ncbi:MAG: RNA polymerase sporulation sigma factor SigE [Ruminococcaceae bacterium]|nr:RNA polymerase sporulation sigma factor SigE [Oscillospiraceae bacterium]